MFCTAEGGAEVAAKFGGGGYVPGLQQGVFEKFAQQFSRDFNAILKCGKTCADADRYSHAFGTILADVDVISHEVQNEQMGTVEKFNENDAVLYEGEIYLEGGKEYAFFVAVDDWASIEIDGEQILSGGYQDVYNGNRWEKGSRLIASKTIEKSGWYPIRVWMCDICGGGVPMLGFGEMGIGWNAEGCKELNAATFSKWQSLRDDGSGRFLRSKPMSQKAAPRCGLFDGGTLRARRLQRQQAVQQVEQKNATVDDYTWSYRVNNGEATIVAENRGKFSCAVSPNPKGNLTIPSTLDGIKVTGIGREAFKGCSGLTSVTIPDSVKSIEGHAFWGCGRLTSLTLPQDLRHIGDSTFRLCVKLMSMTIPSKVERVDAAAFANCDELKEIKVAENNQSFTSLDGVLYTKDMTRLVEGPGKLSSVTMPSSVTRIGAHAFEGCGRLNSVTIPEGVASIDGAAFDGCGGLTSVIVPSTVKYIGWAAFRGCDKMTSVTITEGVNIIGYEAFKGCCRLTSLILPSSLTSIGNAAFRACTNLTSVTIPSNVVSIGVAAFTDCTGLSKIDVAVDNPKYASVGGVLCTKDLKEVVLCPGTLISVALPESVMSIGPCAFEGCGELTSVTMPECITNIGPYAFKRCRKLTSVAIPLRVRSIGGSAFEGCSAMTTVTIPEGVTTVERHVFHNCRGLTTVTISPNVRRIGDWAFSGCSELTSLTLPRALTSIGRCAFQECRGLTSITIPSNVTEVGPWAFENCRELTSVTIPESVSKIERSVFKECVKLTSVALPPKIRNIAEWTFQQCEGLTSVSIPEGVTEILEGAFWRCSKLSSVTVPSSVWSIGARTFEGCGGLMSITMCGGCPNAPRNMFGGCGKLRAIHVPSNSVSWAKMKDWQGIPLVFDGEAMSSEALAREAKAEAERAQREAERAEQWQQLLAIQEELKRVREAKSAEEGGKIYTSCATGNQSAESTVSSVKKENFKAKLTGVAIIEGGRMCGYEARAKEADFQSPDCPIEIPYGKAACFRIEYDFPEGYQARVWTRDRWQKGEDGSSYYFGSNPSPLYKGKGVAYGFLDMLERGKTCTLKRLVIQTNAEPKLDGLPKGWDIVVTPVDIKFHGPKNAQKVSSRGDEKSQRNAVDRPMQSGKTSVAGKLQSCDFLLNKDFKQKAKFYLCLFSASWCPPCRAEMPRIAKTYAEMLKNDPDIELVHFSCDRDDSKALAWAKEHDVKFPVVKPKGGNPLELHCNGIPHLFIVKADGTVLEEGHPMRIFNEEKFKEIKGTGFACDVKSQADKSGNSANGCTEKIDGYTWSYRVNNGEAEIVANVEGRSSCAVAPKPTGHFAIPSTIDDAKVTRIGDSAFYYCDGLESVTIPDGVTSIGNSAFQYCRRLSLVTIPNSVKRIGGGAFYQCWSLRSLTIPSGVTDIGDGAFMYCNRMQKFEVDPSNKNYKSVNGVLLTKDGSRLIAGVNGEVVIPFGVKRIADFAFLERRMLTSVTIPEGVTSIGKWAFFGCNEIGRVDSGLSEIALPASVTSIGERAFGHCSGPKRFVVCPANENFRSENGLLLSKDGKLLIAGINGEVDIPNGVTSIEKYAFDSCRGLIRLTIPASVGNVGDLAFSGCANLTSVTLPSSVTNISESAFRGCPNLTSVTMRGERPNSPDNVFGKCDKLKPRFGSWMTRIAV